MADGEVAEEPAVQQEHRTDIAGSDAAVTSDVSDSQSREEAPDGGNAPIEPDEDPAVGTTHLDNSTEQCHTDDAPTDAHSPAGSPAEGLTQAIPGQDSPGDDPIAAEQEPTPELNTHHDSHAEGQIDITDTLQQSHQDHVVEPDSCSGPAPGTEQPQSDTNVQPEPAPPSPEAPPQEAPPPAPPTSEAPSPPIPPQPVAVDSPGLNEDHTALASESAETIGALPGSKVGHGSGSPPAGSSATAGHATRPVRGTLAKPNRGFQGLFVTRGGRKIQPEELVESVERLSKGDLFGVDMKELLAMYANAPKATTAVGKAQISPEEIESMVERLYSSKPKHGMTYKARPTPMKAIYYIENGAHLSRLEPIAPKPAQERTEFMCSLYERCKESKLKSQQMLADKYLQPLCKPKVYSGPDGKAKIMEIAQKLFAGESTK